MLSVANPLFEIANSSSTIVLTDVAHAGIISNIHISAAYAKIATVRCWITVRPAIGTNHNATTVAKISGNRIQRLMLNDGLLIRMLKIFIVCYILISLIPLPNAPKRHFWAKTAAKLQKKSHMRKRIREFLILF